METVPAKHLLQKTRSPARFGAACNLDLYRGCCHCCIYCDSRSDDCDRVRAKENAIRPAAAGAGGQATTGTVSLGAMSDSYTPFSVLA